MVRCIPFGNKLITISNKYLFFLVRALSCLSTEHSGLLVLHKCPGISEGAQSGLSLSYVIGSAKRGTSSKFSFLNKYNF